MQSVAGLFNCARDSLTSTVEKQQLIDVGTKRAVRGIVYAQFSAEAWGRKRARGPRERTSVERTVKK
jgi:hypothetical protein